MVLDTHTPTIRERSAFPSSFQTGQDQMGLESTSQIGETVTRLKYLVTGSREHPGKKQGKMGWDGTKHVR